MSKIQASARIKIPDGKLEEFKHAAMDYINEVKKKDKGTFQSDWFISSDNSECETRETWESTKSLSHAVSALYPNSIALFMHLEDSLLFNLLKKLLPFFSVSANINPF